LLPLIARYTTIQPFDREAAAFAKFLKQVQDLREEGK